MSISRSGSNSITQACAACKYQRRKCAPDCILAPYFPHDRQRQFQNAHKLFGVSNITKIIRNLNPPEKDIAMHTIVFQSDARANDPVGGCYRIIQELQRQIEYSQAELDLVLHQLAICRAKVAHQQQVTSHLQMQESGCEMVNPDLLNSYNSIYYYIQEPQEKPFAPVNDHTNNNNKQHQLQQHETYDHSWDIHESTTAMSSLNIKQSFIEFCGDHHEEGKSDLGMPCETHEIEFENEELVERRFVPSTQLVMSS
ncbi:mediator of RNA polymerase II transcription subunit 9-like [Hibiscus syriacus]|uniref:Mediator of RNA polymerase II transcription subunit 9-like n=1 Tax=Hibiscus syriacus TaxID=106335 RepID=A0A6A3D0K0_HIBSY|nr:mediator of RNA polymerase II transcription subunit 9-like [Hibiscus syriacus]